MKKAKLTGRNIIIQDLINLIPKELRLRFNPDRYAVEKFVVQASKKTKKDSKILDAGAGLSPYKCFFNHTKYEAADFNNNFGNLDFICSLDKIPKKEGYYDAVICTEVLEHVPNPQEVVNEFYRVLKVGGKLFLTVPQGRAIHQEPHNYFYFTKYGLNLILKNTNFKNIKIQPKGGYFKFLGDAIRFNNILNQYKKYWFIYYPLFIIERVISMIIIFILFHLDFLDKEKKWTSGYLAESIK
ncbi:MAG: class I SAM-dependent methyltransferase [archaeon]